MARESLDRTIDGKNYLFTQYGAKEALKMLVRLSKIIGKPMALSYAALGAKGADGSPEIKGDVLAQAIDALMQNAHEDDVLDICMKLSSKDCLCNGKQIDFNSHFEGQLPHMFKVIKAALEVQYGNFFGALNDLPSMAPILSPIINRGRPTSTGTSGAQ